MQDTIIKITETSSISPRNDTKTEKPEELISLKAREGTLIKIPASYANLSTTLRVLVRNPCFVESRTKIIELPFSMTIIQKGVEYMKLKANNGNVEEFKINDDETLDLLEFSNYLKL